MASPRLVAGLVPPLSLEQLRSLPLLHDAHGYWPTVLKTAQQLPGAVFNQTTLALDAAMAGQGVALACKAFVATDLAAERLVQVAEVGALGADFYLLRKRSAPVRKSVEAVWDWCLHRLLLP